MAATRREDSYNPYRSSYMTDRSAAFGSSRDDESIFPPRNSGATGRSAWAYDSPSYDTGDAEGGTSSSYLSAYTEQYRRRRAMRERLFAPEAPFERPPEETNVAGLRPQALPARSARERPDRDDRPDSAPPAPSSPRGARLGVGERGRDARESIRESPRESPRDSPRGEPGIAGRRGARRGLDDERGPRRYSEDIRNNPFMRVAERERRPPVPARRTFHLEEDGEGVLPSYSRRFSYRDDEEAITAAIEASLALDPSAPEPAPGHGDATHGAESAPSSTRSSDTRRCPVAGCTGIVDVDNPHRQPCGHNAHFEGNATAEVATKYGDGIEIECAVCAEVLRSDAVQLTCGNQHSFDQACVLPWLESNNTCPTCRGVLQRDPFQTPRILKTIVTNLRVHCLHRDFGCTWAGPVKSFSAHALRECTFFNPHLAHLAPATDSTSLTTQQTDLSAAVGALHAQRAELEASVAELTAQRDVLQASIADAEAQRAVTDEALSELRAGQDVAEEQARALRAAQAALEVNLRHLQAQHGDLESGLEELQARRAAATAELLTLESNAAVLRGAVRAVEHEHIQAQSQFMHVQHQHAKLQEECAELQSGLEHRQAACESLESRQHALQAACSVLEDHREMLTRQRNELKLKLEEMDARGGDGASAGDRAAATRELETRSAELHAACTQLEDKEVMLRTTVSELEARRGDLHSACTELEGRQTALRGTIFTLDDQRSSAEVAVDSLEARQVTLTAACAALDDRQRSLEAACSTLENTQSTLRGECAAMETEKRTLIDKRASLQREEDEARSTWTVQRVAAEDEAQRLETRCNVLRASSVALEAERTGLIGARDLLREDAEEEQRLLATVRSSLEGLAAERSAVAADMERLVQERELLMEGVRALEARQDAAHDAEDAAGEMMAELRRQENERDLLMGRLSTALDELGLAVKERDAQTIACSMAMERVSVAEEQVENLRGAYEKTCDEMECLRTELREATREKDIMVDALSNDVLALNQTRNNALAEAEELRVRCAELEQRSVQLETECQTVTELHQQLSAAHSGCSLMDESWKEDHSRLVQEHTALREENALILGELVKLRGVVKSLEEACETAFSERDAAAEARGALASEEHEAERAAAEAEAAEALASAQQELALLQGVHDALLTHHDALKSEHESMAAEHSALASRHQVLTAEHEALVAEATDVRAHSRTEIHAAFDGVDYRELYEKVLRDYAALELRQEGGDELRRRRHRTPTDSPSSRDSHRVKTPNSMPNSPNLSPKRSSKTASNPNLGRPLVQVPPNQAHFDESAAPRRSARDDVAMLRVEFERSRRQTLALFGLVALVLLIVQFWPQLLGVMTDAISIFV